jgi:hypothetical protein
MGTWVPPFFHHFVTYQLHLGTFTEQGVKLLCNVDFGHFGRSDSECSFFYSNIRLNADKFEFTHEKYELVQGKMMINLKMPITLDLRIRVYFNFILLCNSSKNWDTIRKTSQFSPITERAFPTFFNRRKYMNVREFIY